MLETNIRYGKGMESWKRLFRLGSLRFLKIMIITLFFFLPLTWPYNVGKTKLKKHFVFLFQGSG